MQKNLRVMLLFVAVSLVTGCGTKAQSAVKADQDVSEQAEITESDQEVSQNVISPDLDYAAKDDASDECTEEQETDHKLMIMVNGILYRDTGNVSEATGRCGTLDGSITEVIGESETPTKDGQANFDAAGWQIGLEDTIEVPVDNEWRIFAAEGSGKDVKP